MDVIPQRNEAPHELNPHPEASSELPVRQHPLSVPIEIEINFEMSKDKGFLFFLF